MATRARLFTGIGASPGVAVGKVYVLDRRQVRAPRYHVRPDRVVGEVERLVAAIDLSVRQLEAIRGRLSGEGLAHHSIIAAHELMLRDPALLDGATALIRDEKCNAEWAVGRVIGGFRQTFERLSDSYLRERRGDLDDVGERLIRNLTGQPLVHADELRIDDGAIIVAHDLSPVDAALLSRHKVGAFVTEVGGKTSHTSIIARALEVPAVVGVHGIFEVAGTGDGIIVDGLRGQVVLRPSRAQATRGRARSASYRRANLDLLEARAVPAVTLDGVHVRVSGNIELPHEVANVIDRGGEGVGLYRTEFLFLGRATPPSADEHRRTYESIAQDLGEQTATVRTFDLGGEKLFAGTPHESEGNPALGLRAIRYCLAHPEIFATQISGLLQAAASVPLRVMLPMISGLDELRAAKAIIETVATRLRREGQPCADRLSIGVMLEVPSAVLTADLIAPEVDFFAVGTNDLLQYLLAVDRTNERVAHLYRPLHPAVLRILARVQEAALAARIPVSICGEMAGEVEYLPVLLGFGFAQLSMNAGSIPQIKRMVRELDTRDCAELLQDLLRLSRPDECETRVADFLNAKLPHVRELWQPVVDDEDAVVEQVGE